MIMIRIIITNIHNYLIYIYIYIHIYIHTYLHMYYRRGGRGRVPATTVPITRSSRS